MTDLLICPKTHKKLYLSADGKYYQTEDGEIKYPIENGIIRFIEKNDDFYEAKYSATVEWVPKSEKWYHIWPLWFINNNYLWIVRKYVKKNSLVLEIGTGGGIEYFGQRFKMIGLDISYSSLLSCPESYKIKLNANATNIPLARESVDVIISSCFWEHIDIANKSKMLEEFNRVLKQEGIIIFLFDIHSENKMIKLIRNKNPEFYYKEFIELDNHRGYLTAEENISLFQRQYFDVLKIFGIEKTMLQTSSVYGKASKLNGTIGKINLFIYNLLQNRYLNHLNNALVISIDKTIGKMIPLTKSRMIVTILRKEINVKK